MYNGGTLYFWALSYVQKSTSPTDLTRLTLPTIPTRTSGMTAVSVESSDSTKPW